MFYCQVSKKFSKLGEAQHKITIETRPKEYYGWKLNDSENKYDDDYQWVKVAEGFETVKEINACEEGIVLWNSWTTEQQQAFAKMLNEPIQKKETSRRVIK